MSLNLFDNFDVGDQITIKMVNRQCLNAMILSDPYLSQLAIEEALVLDPETLIRNLSGKVMNNRALFEIMNRSY
uniref:Uncharacterized protein n=1 Tax=Strongyloides venezuelensis TaxID=75913 RepID=A0A0K0FR21_STRVS